MGSRIVVPLLAALLVIGGFAAWTFSSKGTPAPEPLRSPAAVEVSRSSPDTAEGIDVPVEVAGDVESPSRRALTSAPAAVPERPKRAEPSEGKLAVVGRVTDKFKNPVVGARVRLLDPNSAFDFSVFDGSAAREGGLLETVTGTDGRFEIDAASAGMVTLSLRADGFAPLEKSQVSIPPAKRHDLGDFVLSAGAILSGQVVDSNGRPVEGAELLLASARDGFFASDVLMSRLREPLAITAADGSFRVDELACGHWQILVKSETEPSGVFEGDAEVPGVEIFGLEFKLPASATIAGRALGIPKDETDRLVVRARPVVDDAIGFSPRGTRTAALANDGAFLLPGLESDQQYDLQVREANEGDFGLFGGAARSDTVRARAGDRGVELSYNLGARLAFVVADASSGERVTSMEVFAGMDWPMPVRGEDGRVRREFPEGRVEVSELFPRKDKNAVTLRIRATGYAEYERKGILLEPGRDLDLGKIELAPVPVVVVTVVDDRSNEPVEGAKVSLRPKQPPAPGDMFSMRAEVSVGHDDVGDVVEVGGEGSRARTDENGVAVLTSIEGETCELRVESPSHAPALVDGLVLPRGQRVVQEVRLLHGGVVVVSVVGGDGAPVPGVKVEHRPPSQDAGTIVLGGLHGPQQMTDAEGVVVFEHLEAGLHAFRIAESGGGGPAFFGESSVVMIGGPANAGGEPWTEVEIVEDAVREVTLSAPPRGRIEGRIREGGVPLAGATVRLQKRSDGNGMPDGMQIMGMLGGGGPKTESDGDGQYAFDDVKPGEYTLEVSHPQRVLPAKRDLEVEERGGEVFERVDLELAVSVIEGRIEDDEGRPLANVEVWAERVQAGPSATVVSRFVMIGGDEGTESVTMGGDAAGKRVRSDADGIYRLRGVPEDVDLVVKADAAFYEAAESETVRVAPDQVRRGVDLSLEGAGQIEVSVTAPDGSPRGMCMCTATYQGEGLEPVRDVVGPSGRLVLTGLRPGRWSVGVQAFGFEGGGTSVPQEARPVEVVVGETAKVTLAAP